MIGTFIYEKECMFNHVVGDAIAMHVEHYYISDSIQISTSAAESTKIKSFARRWKQGDLK